LGAWFFWNTVYNPGSNGSSMHTGVQVDKALSTLATTVAEFGDKLSPFPATIVASVDRA